MSGWNGSGGFSFSFSFTPNTTISSSQMNQQFTDAVTGFQNCVTRDGQGQMNSQFRIIAGTEAAPGIAFSSDLNTGIWRVAADTIGFSCNGAEVFELAPTGASVIGDLDVSGNITGTFGAFSATTIKVGDGTVLLPSYSFTNDTADGFYRIGSHNIGYSANGVKLLDLGAGVAGVIGTLAVTGAATVSTTLAVTGASTLTGAVTMSTGGTLTGTFGGNPTFSGNPAFSGTPTYTNFLVAKNAPVAFAACTVSGGVVSFTSASWQNVASITRTGTGSFDVLYTTAVPTNNAVICSAQAAGAFRVANITSKSTTGFTIKVQNSAPASADPDGLDFVVLGF